MAVRTISTRADYALELLKLFSMDTDRIVRSVVIGTIIADVVALIIVVVASMIEFCTNR